ncbi:19531_t:CDS:2 [Funneliformis geosporum]|uniref:19531_t:CDS:1 n=1 Tax=Funneliformis geosporum TaxID=1117311 RepID=A0A9W4SX24_9GLOM|nr:19531_t:CDS:2 [Funneliformis geosporum]
MTSKINNRLSQEFKNDFLNLLENDDEHDVIIKAGEEPNTKKFKAHYYILKLRSPYFRQALSSRWAIKEDGKSVFTKPNITPETFNIILNYIYSSDIDVEKFNEAQIVDVLGAADELCLSVLVEVLQEELLDRKHIWMNKQSPGIKGKSLYLITKEYTRGHARIQSVLIKPHHAAKIASWIDRLDSSDNQIPYYTPSNIPYYFKLVARGSRDQPFLQQTLNDNRAVVLIKPANSNEILGGYNPLTWSKKSISSNSNKDQQSNKDDIPLKNSFIFNLRKDPDDKEDILSRVINPIDSIYCNVYCSPVFGKGDLFPKGHFEIGQPCGCKQTSYEKSLRASTDQFPIEEFEVFQIIKKTVL